MGGFRVLTLSVLVLCVCLERPGVLTLRLLRDSDAGVIVACPWFTLAVLLLLIWISGSARGELLVV